MFPSLQITKYQVVEYYVRIGPRMLVFLSVGSLVTNRFPAGADEGGFYEKIPSKVTLRWMKIVKRFSENAGREIRYPICDNIDTLIRFANLAAIVSRLQKILIL